MSADEPLRPDPQTPPGPILVAIRAKSDREPVAAARRAVGHEVLEISDSAELQLVLGSPSAGLVVDDALALDALHALAPLADAARPVIVAVRSAVDVEWVDALEEAGASGFVSLPVVPALLRRALRSQRPPEGVPSPAPPTGPPAPAGGGTQDLIDVARLERRFQAAISVARSEEHHLALLALTLHPLGGPAGPLDPERLEAAVMERVRRVFDRADDEEGWLKPGDEVHAARLDDHTFLFLVTGMRRIQDAARVGGRLTAGFLDLGDGRQLDQRVGIATFPEDGSEPKALIECARKAAERVRTEGREQLAYYTQSMGRWAFERLTLEKSLRDAIANGELRVHYQPRVDIETRRIKGLECLVRWQHPQLGLVSPGQFIPLAEETGLIVPIGEWVLREACRQNQAWREAGLPSIRVSVNLSPVQFRKPRLYETVLEVLRETGLDEDGLELELTESMLMNDPNSTVETLRKLRSAGVRLSIDDFGTGYSSLSYLKRFPIDALKIDRSFVDEITTSPDNAAIATAIILMGHSLRLTVVAEGVETESQLEFLRVLKCNEIQGFLFSPPVPAEVAEDLMRREMSAA